MPRPNLRHAAAIAITFAVAGGMLPLSMQADSVTPAAGAFAVHGALGAFARPAGAASLPSDAPLTVAGTLVFAQQSKAVSGNVIEDSVNLRAGPGTSYRALGKLKSDTRVGVLGREGGWYRINTPRGSIGWVLTEFIALDVVAPHLAPGGGKPAPASNDAARLAQQFIGARYVWGGASPKQGFDCSGFTQYIYRQVGVRLPRRASQQFSTRYGKRVNTIKALAPGDLVYFERTTEERGITHAGIYVGNGRMIAARSERLGVRIVSMYEPFWNTRFVGGIRPFR